MKSTAALLAVSGLLTPSQADGSNRYLAADIDGKRLPMSKQAFLKETSAESVLYMDFHSLYDTFVLSESEPSSGSAAAEGQALQAGTGAQRSAQGHSSVEHAGYGGDAVDSRSLRPSESRWWGAVNTCCAPSAAGSAAGVRCPAATSATAAGAASGPKAATGSAPGAGSPSTGESCQSFGPLVVSHRSVQKCVARPVGAGGTTSSGTGEGKGEGKGTATTETYWTQVPELSTWSGPDWLLVHQPGAAPGVAGAAVDLGDSLARVIRTIVSGSATTAHAGRSRYTAQGQAQAAEKGAASSQAAPQTVQYQANRTPGSPPSAAGGAGSGVGTGSAAGSGATGTQGQEGEAVTMTVPSTGQASRSGLEQPVPHQTHGGHGSVKKTPGAAGPGPGSWYGLPGVLEVGTAPFIDIIRPKGPGAVLRSLASYVRSFVQGPAAREQEVRQGQQQEEEEGGDWALTGRVAGGKVLTHSDVHRLYPLIRTAPVRALSSADAGEGEAGAGFAAFSRWAWDETRTLLAGSAHATTLVQHVDAHLSAHEAWVHVAARGEAANASSSGGGSGGASGTGTGCGEGDYRLSWSEWRLPAGKMRLLLRGIQVNASSGSSLISAEGLVRASGSGAGAGAGEYLPVSHWWSEGKARWFDTSFIRVCTPDKGQSWGSCADLQRTPSLRSMLSFLPASSGEDPSGALAHMRSAGWGGHGPGQGMRTLHLLGWGGAPLLALFLCVIGAGAVQAMLHLLHPGMRLAFSSSSPGGSSSSSSSGLLGGLGLELVVSPLPGSPQAKQGGKKD